MVNIKIDGRRVQAPEGSSVMESAQKLKLQIPTLCYHRELSPWGACRLCMVEVKEAGGWKLAAACTTPVAEGLEVRTDTQTVKESRRFAAGMLYYKYPGDKTVEKIARTLGVRTDGKATKEECVLCGLCVRACREIVEADALAFRERSTSNEEPGIGFDAARCIGCGSCVFVCPTSYVKMEEAKGKRTVWDKVFRMAACSQCGRYFAPLEQLEFISKKTGVPVKKLMLCTSCR